MIRRPPRSTLFPYNDALPICLQGDFAEHLATLDRLGVDGVDVRRPEQLDDIDARSEEHTSELQSPCNLVCRLLLEKKNEKFSGRVLKLTRGHQRLDTLALAHF